MEELRAKREELKTLLVSVQTKKAEMEQMVQTVQLAVQQGMDIEWKELEELKSISVELSSSNLQSTVQQLMEWKQTLQCSIEPLVSLATSNNEFAATVLQTLQDSGSAIQQVQSLFVELESELGNVKTVLQTIGVHM